MDEKSKSQNLKVGKSREIAGDVLLMHLFIEDIQFVTVDVLFVVFY